MYNLYYNKCYTNIINVLEIMKYKHKNSYNFFLLVIFLFLEHFPVQASNNNQFKKQIPRTRVHLRFNPRCTTYVINIKYIPT